MREELYLQSGIIKGMIEPMMEHAYNVSEGQQRRGVASLGVLNMNSNIDDKRLGVNIYCLT